LLQLPPKLPLSSDTQNYVGEYFLSILEKLADSTNTTNQMSRDIHSRAKLRPREPRRLPILTRLVLPERYSISLPYKS